MNDEPSASFLFEKQPWVAEAACRNVPTDIFFEMTWEHEALGYCQGCAVRPDCLAAALVEEGPAPYGRYGVRGGTTAEERGRLRRKHFSAMVNDSKKERP